jgi:galactose mutarotase-like enzyme
MTKTEIEHRTWGEWPSIRLFTPAVELEVVGQVGARIVSLRDRRRDREWLVQGEPPTELEQMAWATEGVSFGGRESFGWDECLPTTSVCPDPLDPDGPALRDHGDQWGRGAYLSLDVEEGAVVHTWSGPRWGYRMSRRLSFEDNQTLLVEYLVASIATQALPIHWAQHPVLKLEPGSYLDLPEVEQARRSWQHGIDLPDKMTWPKATTDAGREIDLGQVRRAEGWAAVLYAEPTEEIRAVAPDGARLDLDWDRDFAPALRIWLACGGWPPGGPPAEQVALEPCTSMHDDLAGALEAGQERILEPGAELRWWVRLRLSS